MTEDYDKALQELVTQGWDEAKAQVFLDFNEDRIDRVLSGTEFDQDSYCDECGEELPEPKYESRGEGYSEAVIYCDCGATYTS